MKEAVSAFQDGSPVLESLQGGYKCVTLSDGRGLTVGFRGDEKVPLSKFSHREGLVHWQ